MSGRVCNTDSLGLFFFVLFLVHMQSTNSTAMKVNNIDSPQSQKKEKKMHFDRIAFLHREFQSFH